MSLPTIALSIIQPWAWLIVNGYKDIENRDWRWPPSLRGPFLVHASKGWDQDVHDDLIEGLHPVTGEHVSMEIFDAYTAAFKAGQVHRGGIVGVATLAEVVTSSSSPWFVGQLGFVIRDAQPLPFMPCRGALGFFKPDLSATTA